MRQNDTRTSSVVDKLSGLRNNLDGIFEDLERDIAHTSTENEELREKWNSLDQTPNVVEVKRENVEARRRLEAQLEEVRRENQAIRDREL